MRPGAGWWRAGGWDALRSCSPALPRSGCTVSNHTHPLPSPPHTHLPPARLLDDNRELYVPELQEVVRPHPHFMLFATQNPPGIYAGRKTLSR